MAFSSPLAALQRYYRRKSASFVFRRPMVIATKRPIISFTFDDFPRSALLTGGCILERHGLRGTYYASFGLMGKTEPTGEIFLKEDLNRLIGQGHELGCHTFSHCDSWETGPKQFEQSILANRSSLKQFFPEAEFKSFSYPISLPRPLTKAKMAAHFLCCRGGGQRANIGTADLNQLAAFFLEKSRSNIQTVKDLIDQNGQSNGWLIFATHDVDENPTPFGCTPSFFQSVVQYAFDSGACVLPVIQALERLRRSWVN